MRLIDADALKEKKVYCPERHEKVVPVAEIDWMPTVEQPHWISVNERMPAETHSMFFKLYGTPKWRNNAMWREESDHVLVAIAFEDGSRFVTSGYTQDGKWSTGISKILQYTVTHWMPLPTPPEVNRDED